MRALTYSELNKVRRDKQFCSLGLIIPTPETVATGRITAAPSSNDSVVQLSWTVTGGSISDVLVGMTCWIGTTLGGHEKGVVRIRKLPTVGTLYIGEVSEIFWSGNEYVTIVREFAIWRRDLRTVNETDFYMDWDIAYTNQHTNPAPVVNMGIDAVVDVTDGEQLVDWNGESSFVITGYVSNYLWDAWGSSSESGMDTSTPQIGVSSVGSHMVSCRCTASGGTQHTGYRFIHAIDEDNPGILDFELNRLEGNFEDGGWSAEITLHEAKDIPDRARVVLFARDWYQGTESEIGYEEGRKNIVFIGWVVGRTVTIDPITNSTTFKVVGPQYWIRLIKGFPAGVEDTNFADNGGGNPNRWTEMKDLTPAKGLWHFLHWRSTATLCTDIFLPVDPRLAARTQSPTGTLWDQLIVLSNQVNLSYPCCDKFGRIFVLPYLQYVPLDERDSVPVILSIIPDDYSDLIIEPRQIPGLYYVEVSGVYYSGGKGTPIGAQAPGSTWRWMGENELTFAELVMSTWNEAIELAGLILGSQAGEIAHVSITLEQLNRMFDVTPHSYVRLTISADDNDQGIVVAAERFVAKVVRFNYDGATGIMTTELDLDPEGIQLPAVKMKFPGEDGPPVEPPVEPPRPPEPPNPPGPPGPPNPPAPETGDALVLTADDFRMSNNFDDTDPDWTTRILGGAVNPSGYLVDSALAPDDKQCWVLGRQAVWLTSDIWAETVEWNEVYTAQQFEEDNACDENTALFYRLNCKQVGLAGVLVAAIETGKQDYSIFYLKTASAGLGWQAYLVEDGIAEGDTYYSYMGGVGVEEEHPGGGSIQDADVPCSAGGECGGGAVAVIQGGWPAWVTYDMGYVRTTNSITVRWKHDGIWGIYGSIDGITNWQPLKTGQTSYTDQDASCGTRVYGFQGGTTSFRFIRFQVTERVQTGGRLEIAWWSIPEAIPVIPTAMDTADLNVNWVYIGLPDRIKGTEDGGQTWFDFYGTGVGCGANDLRVDPQAAGAVYFWSDDGKLNLLVKSAIGGAGTLSQSSIMTEVPNKGYYRIGRDPSSGRLLALPGGTKITMRNLGTNLDLLTGLNDACGLQVYTGQRFIFVDRHQIYFCDNLWDMAPIIDAKTGTWSEFFRGLNTHLTGAA